jgi:hypothetical protein
MAIEDAGVATDPIDEYVTGLRRTLRGPGRAKRDLLVEAHDSLLDAAEAYAADGLERVEAERLAVEEFGSLSVIAPAFQEELAVAQGRRTAFLVFLSVPLTALMWGFLWRVFPHDPSAAPQPQWFRAVSVTMDCAQIVTGLLGGLALMALGRGVRRVRRPELVIRSLGLLVWLQMPLTLAMCMALTYGAPGSVGGLTHFPPGVALGVITALSFSWQLFSAPRCLTVARVITASD